MLNFKTTQDFENVMSKISGNSEFGLPQKVESIINKPKFVSYYTKQKNAIATNLIIPLDTEYDDIISDTTNEEPFDDLVPDPFFASLINDKLEIEVEGVIYKITPYGTFIIKPEKLERLNDILINNTFDENQNFINHSFYKNKMNDDFYKIEDGIILLDTYKRLNNDTLISVVNNNLSLSKKPYVSQLKHKSQIRSTMNIDAENWIYENIPTVQFGGKTLAGKLFQSLRGREEVHTQNFSNKNRVRVNFYNATWGVYSAIGINVTMQKKIG